jgi:hypothetical protein
MEPGSVTVGIVEVIVHSYKVTTFAVRIFQKSLILHIIAKQIPCKK